MAHVALRRAVVYYIEAVASTSTSKHAATWPLMLHMPTSENYLTLDHAGHLGARELEQRLDVHVVSR